MTRAQAEAFREALRSKMDECYRQNLGNVKLRAVPAYKFQIQVPTERAEELRAHARSILADDGSGSLMLAGEVPRVIVERHPNEVAKYRKLGDLKEALAARIRDTQLDAAVVLVPEFSKFVINIQVGGGATQLLLEVHSPTGFDVNDSLLLTALKWRRGDLEAAAAARWRR